MHLKLGVVLDKTTNLKNIENTIDEILVPYLTSTPTKEIFFGDKYNKNEMKSIYRNYKLETYDGVSNKKKSEDLKNKGIDTLEGFAKEMYGIIRFTEEGEAVGFFNPKGFIDEYKFDYIKKIKDFEENFLALNLKSLIDKDLKVYQREIQAFKLTPSTELSPIINNQKQFDYIAIVNYSF